MGKKELNNWAVMNYSMEDRGAQPQEPHHGHGLTQRVQTDRFLSGNLSYFGVRRPVLILLLLLAHTTPYTCTVQHCELQGARSAIVGGPCRLL